ncbi:MAG: hypothetical protein HOJ02_01450 [Rhodospirillaceae bacterium]|jgi:hypothetical protein|nr:hypothetical protein [Rhodospirillaceae bacterium]MBT5658797.1 hypothetical protein [Rhodospirillaceae bacterium]
MTRDRLRFLPPDVNATSAGEEKHVEGLPALKREMEEHLPALIVRALAHYRVFSSQTPPPDAKGFSAHFSACKAALAHLESLIKLAGWAEAESGANDASGNGGEGDEMARLLAEAKAAVGDMGEMDFGKDDALDAGGGL